MVTVVIPHVPIDDTFEKRLDDCIKSLWGEYDELILVVNDGIGYGKSFNRGFKYARGDYIIGVSNDTIVVNGSIRDLCDPDAVTFTNSQWGCFFCIPRWVYEKIGGFDESFGLAYAEDEDYLMRLEDAGIPLRRSNKVIVAHEGGATVKALGKEQEASAFGNKRHQEKWGNRRAVIPE